MKNRIVVNEKVYTKVINQNINNIINCKNDLKELNNIIKFNNQSARKMNKNFKEEKDTSKKLAYKLQMDLNKQLIKFIKLNLKDNFLRVYLNKYYLLQELNIMYQEYLYKH